ncbi:ROK family protein [Gulosibacter massiliensis]|uniref:ROK family protein n=1 Tax=Gulosibacter massiliensis TaxID=2479839 RepID=UPI000F631F0B|nr:ROK family protein [Gulosibacter massiliensis]
MSSTAPTERGSVLAIDIGGTKIEAGIVTAEGALLPDSRVRVATGAAANSAEGFDSALRDAVAQASAHPAFDDVVGVGIGSAGPLDLGAGTVSPINLPGVRAFPVVRTAREASGLQRVSLRLDGTSLGLAELWQGAAQGVRNAVIFVVSTGIGGCVVTDGRVVAGASGNAGHLGQMVVDVVDPEHPERATVEGQASGMHTVAWARAHGWSGSTGEDLAAAHAAGDEIALAAVERSVQALGRGLASCANLLNTELAVMGGGFAHVTEDYPARVERAAHTASVNEFGRALRVVRVGLGDEAPLVGAAAQLLHPELLA